MNTKAYRLASRYGCAQGPFAKRSGGRRVGFYAGGVRDKSHSSVHDKTD